MVPVRRTRARVPSVTFAPMLSMIPGWKTRAATAATRTEIARTGRAGIRFRISTSVSSGTMNNQGVMQNFSVRTVVYRSIWVASAGGRSRPMSVKMMSLMTIDGTVVHTIYRICGQTAGLC